MRSRVPRGEVVDHPAVLEIIEANLAPTEPHLHERRGRLVMLTRKTRFWLQRDWVDCLPSDGIFLQRVEPGDGPVTWIAMTRRELEETFANVFGRDDWGSAPYHYPKIPIRKAAAFLIPGATTGGRGTARAVWTADTESARLFPSAGRSAGRDDGLEDASLLDFNERWSRRAGVQPESAEYLARVDGWRRAFRPEHVRVLLVAESHVREADGDIDVRIDMSATDDELAIAPPGYCRLIYCLGYGADSICQPAPLAANGGTNYWTLFARLAGKTIHPLVTPKKREDLGRKAVVLAHLRANGVWLIDASALGIYQPGGGAAFRGNAYRDMVRESWRWLVRPSIAEEPLEQVVVIGHTVRRALGPDLGLGAPEWTIAQPSWGHMKRHQRELAEVLPHLPWDAPAAAEN